jgi:hypothetical protein
MGSGERRVYRSQWKVLFCAASMLACLALAMTPMMGEVARASLQREASGSMRLTERVAVVRMIAAQGGNPAAGDSGTGGVGLPSGESGLPPASLLTAVPYMGWNTYYGVGGVFDERTIISVANALIDRGLAQAGYRIVWLDFGWASGERDSRGELIVNPQQWPHGLKWLTGWLHRRGLFAGTQRLLRAGCGIARPL